MLSNPAEPPLRLRVALPACPARASGGKPRVHPMAISAGSLMPRHSLRRWQSRGGLPRTRRRLEGSPSGSGGRQQPPSHSCKTGKTGRSGRAGILRVQQQQVWQGRSAKGFGGGEGGRTVPRERRRTPAAGAPAGVCRAALRSGDRHRRRHGCACCSVTSLDLVEFYRNGIRSFHASLPPPVHPSGLLMPGNICF